MEKNINDLLVEFLDTEDLAEKLEILEQMDEVGLTDSIIDSMAFSLDTMIPEGQIQNRYEELRKTIKTHQKYELKRK